MNRPSICISPIDWGLGHATRCITLIKAFEKLGYQTFAKTGDLYQLFYEKSVDLLSKNGISCFITSNKWMRAGYGEKLRKFFLTQTKPLILFDLGGDVFESATVDSNILICQKK